MSYARSLLEQARHLARGKRGRPRQADLRRAISAAYYALFHFLVDQSCRQVIGAGHRYAKLRRILARAFEHRGMKAVSRRFAAGNLLPTPSGEIRVPEPLQKVAETFVVLQEQRHQADYNLARLFRREETEILLDRVVECLTLWEQDHGRDATARLYLAALLGGERVLGR